MLYLRRSEVKRLARKFKYKGEVEFKQSINYLSFKERFILSFKILFNMEI